MNFYNIYSDGEEKELNQLYDQPYCDGYTEDVTGDACMGDEIAFAEVIPGSYFTSLLFGNYRLIKGLILKDSYGTAMQQHTFTIQLANGEKICRKAQTIYKFLTIAKPRKKEERQAILDEKHKRDEKAHIAKMQRLLYT